MLSENIYILKRKMQAKCLSFSFLMMRVFPVRNDKIVFAAFEGDGGFGCNPKYIAEELHCRNDKYKMIWLTHDTSREYPEYICPVKDSNFNTAYHLSTARVWVDNYRKPYGTLKRKGQLYIQTWHASIGFKAVGLLRGDDFPKIARLVSQWDSDLVDYVISNSDYCDRIYPEKLLYNGLTIRTGSPRCDCIVGDRTNVRLNIRKRYHLSENIKILLYAPTFRGGTQKGRKAVNANFPTLDFGRLTDCLSYRFGGDWKVLLRLHPQVAAAYKEMPLQEKKEYMIDVSQAGDISELIAASDVLITDYSSCAFDAAYGYIPVFIYADDMEKYRRSRGEFLWKREELPFLTAETNDELLRNIEKFDEGKYRALVSRFMNLQGVVEDGHASERVADVIEDWMR